MSLDHACATKRALTNVCPSTLCRAFGGPIKILSLLTDQQTQFPSISQLQQDEKDPRCNIHYHKTKRIISRAKRRLPHTSSKHRKLNITQRRKQSEERTWQKNMMAAILALAIKRVAIVRNEVYSSSLAIQLLTGRLEVVSPENDFVRGCFVYCLAYLVFSKQQSVGNCHGIDCSSIDQFAMNACVGDRQFIPILILVLIDSISCWSAKYALHTTPSALDHGNTSEIDR